MDRDNLGLAPLEAEGKGVHWRGARLCVAEGGGLPSSAPSLNSSRSTMPSMVPAPQLSMHAAHRSRQWCSMGPADAYSAPVSLNPCPAVQIPPMDAFQYYANQLAMLTNDAVHNPQALHHGTHFHQHIPSAASAASNAVASAASNAVASNAAAAAAVSSVGGRDPLAAAHVRWQQSLSDSPNEAAASAPQCPRTSSGAGNVPNTSSAFAGDAAAVSSVGGRDPLAAARVHWQQSSDNPPSEATASVPHRPSTTSGAGVVPNTSSAFVQASPFFPSHQIGVDPFVSTEPPSRPVFATAIPASGSVHTQQCSGGIPEESSNSERVADSDFFSDLGTSVSRASQQQEYRSKLRAVNNVVASRDLKYDIPHGVLLGPIPGDKQALKHQVNRVASNPTTQGGGYGVAYASQPKTAKSHGDTVLLRCSKFKQAECCGFQLKYEESAEGWILTKFRPHLDKFGQPTENCHSHPTYQTFAEVIASRDVPNRIPPELADLAVGMSKTSSVAEVDKCLRENARQMGLEVTWTFDFLRNNLQTGSGQDGGHEILFQNIGEVLKVRQSTTDLKSFVEASSDGFIDRAAWEMEGGRELWAKGTDSNVLLFDPTWGTNSQGMKLCCFTSVGATGGTQVVMAVLLKEETRAMFEWAFRCFASVFKVAPAAIFTDGDGEIAEAVEAMHTTMYHVVDNAYTEPPWMVTKHFLCVYHISKNFVTNLRGLLGNDPDNVQWKQALNTFWSIAKRRDERYYEHQFDAEWKELVDLFEEHVSESPAKQRGINWLRTSLYEKRHKWAARYVWRSKTCGLHSTQRAEAVHSALKKHLKKKIDVKELIKKMDAYNESVHQRKAVEMEVLRLRQLCGGGSSALVDFLHKKLTPYAFKLVLQQHQQALQYNSRHDMIDTEDDDTIIDPSALVVTRRQTDSSGNSCLVLDDTGNIDWSSTCSTIDDNLDNDSRGSRLTTATTCSCLFPIAFLGLPYRHIQHFHIVTKTVDFEPLMTNMDTKWLELGEVGEERLLVNLMKKKKPESVHGFTRTTSILTKTERHQILLQKAETLCVLPSTTNKRFETASTELDEMIALMVQSRIQPRRQSAGQSSSHRTEASVEEVAAEVNAAPNRPTARSTKRSPGDEASLNNALGLSFTPSSTPPELLFLDNDWWRKLLGRYIAVKWNGKCQGGWFLGNIIGVGVSDNETLLNGEPDSSSSEDELALKEGTVLIAFPSDGTNTEFTLLYKFYSETAYAQKNSWMLLDEKALGRDDVSDLHDPLPKAKRGRPRTTRFAPPPGVPTARRSRHKR